MASGSLFYTRITRLTRVFLHPPLPRAAVGVIYFPWAIQMHCAGLASERLGNWLKVPTGKMHSRPCTPSLTHWTLGKTMQSPARGTKRALLTPFPLTSSGYWKRAPRSNHRGFLHLLIAILWQFVATFCNFLQLFSNFLQHLLQPFGNFRNLFLAFLQPF